MEPTTPNPTMQPPVEQPIVSATNKSSIGSIIAAIVIIAIIILGGLYFWGKRVEEAKIRADLVKESTENVPVQENTVVDEATSITTTSNSDDLNAIEADLNNTNLVDLDAEINPQAQ